MAELTLEQIRATVRRRGDYTNERKFPNSAVDEEIQKGFEKFWALVDKHHQGYWDTTGDRQTIPGQGYVALPDECWRVKLVMRVDGSDFEELSQVGPDALLRYGAQTGRPSAYRLTARGADLYSTPDGSYTIRFVYTPRAPKLAVSQPREWFNGWDDYVIECALIELDRSDKKPIGDRLAVLEQIAARVESEAGERRQQEPEYLRLREYDGNIDIYGDL